MDGVVEKSAQTCYRRLIEWPSFALFRISFFIIAAAPRRSLLEKLVEIFNKENGSGSTYHPRSSRRQGEHSRWACRLPHVSHDDCEIQASGGRKWMLRIHGDIVRVWRATACYSGHWGWRTFYKGSGTILGGIPSTALYMTTYQTMKRLLPGGQDSPVAQFGGSVLATSASSVVSVPVEVIRQRQMV